MERNEAIEVIKKNYPHVTESGSQFETALRLLIPELKESEDERIRKEIIDFATKANNGFTSILANNYNFNKWLAWLEKQGEHAKFRDSIQVGDKVTRNKDGMLVNLSQLKRVAKHGEQRPTDLRTWKYIVDAVLTEREGIGQYLDNPWTTEVAEKLQKRFGNIEQKPIEWGEEDKKTVHLACEFIRHHSNHTDSIGGIDCTTLIDRLKSLKDRVQPKSAEWTAEDEDMCYKATAVINRLCAEGKDYVWSIKTLNKLFYWLKSLKDRYTWQPSDE